MTGRDVERIDPAYAAAMPAPQGGALPTGLEWQALDRMAHTLADSNLIPYRLKGKPGDVAVILLAAREYGIPPLMALTKLPVVNGTPAPMGELMVALVLRAGHYIGADFRNPDGTVYAGGPVTPQHYGEARYKRRDWTEREVMRFTLEEALTAGLIDRIDDGRAIARVVKFKDGNRVEEPTPWEQWTPNMARWRAVANACRLTFPDVLLGLSYLPEELGATVDAEGAPVEGIVVEERRQAPAAGTIEQRTAQDNATRLEDYVGPLDVLDKLEAHAAENGYSAELVDYAGMRLPFVDAVRDRRDVLERTVVTEDGDTVHPDTNAPTEAPEAPPATEEAPAAPPPPATPPQAASEAPTAPTPADGPEGIDDALDIAREALNSRDLELVRSLYRGAGGQLRALDVAGVVSDDDLAVLGLPNTFPEDGPQAIPLGSLLVKIGSYVDRHKAAVRDLDQGPDPS